MNTRVTFILLIILYGFSNACYSSDDFMDEVCTYEVESFLLNSKVIDLPVVKIPAFDQVDAEMFGSYVTVVEDVDFGEAYFWLGLKRSALNEVAETGLFYGDEGKSVKLIEGSILGFVKINNDSLYLVMNEHQEHLLHSVLYRIDFQKNHTEPFTVTNLSNFNAILADMRFIGSAIIISGYYESSTFAAKLEPSNDGFLRTDLMPKSEKVCKRWGLPKNNN